MSVFPVPIGNQIKIAKKTSDNINLKKKNIPGGPNRSKPFGGLLNPVKISGRCIGQTTISVIDLFASVKPAISVHVVVKFNSIIYINIS